jgi:hypothetical protein
MEAYSPHRSKNQLVLIFVRKLTMSFIVFPSAFLVQQFLRIECQTVHQP